MTTLAERAYAAIAVRADLVGEATLRRVAKEFGVNSGAWRGTLLDVVRRAWGDPSMYAQDRGPDGWWVWQSDPNGNTVARGNASETEALVAALEASPR